MIDLGTNDSGLGPVGVALRPFRDSGTVRDAAAFRGRLEGFQQHVEERQHALLKRVLAEAMTNLVMATPVDTGRARSNWQVQALPAAPEVTLADPTGQSAVTEGYRRIGQIPKHQRKAYLVNPVAYMERLNQGWSRQAPSGWIDAVLARVLQKYARAK